MKVIEKKFLKIEKKFVEEFLENNVPVFCNIWNIEDPEVGPQPDIHEKFVEYKENIDGEYFVEVSAYLECGHYLEQIEKYGYQGMVNETDYCHRCGNCYE